MYKISFYVPESHLEAVKTALFTKGAGKIGNYDSCAWQVLGRGQFRPLDGSQPFSGKIDEINHDNEYMVEMVCENSLIKSVIKELIDVHPYETPAYAVYKIMQLEDL